MNLPDKSDNKSILRKFMNVYWLRPETALWRAIDLMQLRHYEFTRPMLDLGCGDGIFSFIAMGGEFGLGFDMFRAVKDSKNFFQGDDIYNYYEEGLIKRDIITPPHQKIDVGLDLKPNLLKKASELGLYESLVQHDANYPLPFAGGQFSTIFSNIVYWISNIEGLLGELGRVVADDGQILLMLPNDSLKKYYLYNYYLKYGWEWIKKLDRERYSLVEQTYSYEEWRELFAKCGLKISSHRTHLSKTVIQLWDIGLRPISPLLIKMANSLTEETRAAIKAEWIDTVVELIEPLCTTEWITDKQYPPAFHLFQLVRG